MSSKVCSLLASVLLIQSACGQCLNYLQASAPVVEVISSAPAYNLGGCGANLALANNAYGFNGLNGLNGLNSISGLGINGLNGLNSISGLGLNGLNGVDALSVASGSAYAPGGISILGENLLIQGELAVLGSAPFMGTVGVSGAVPTQGQALVSYNTASGVGLSSGGCGQGVSAAAPIGVYETVGLGLNNAGFSNNGGFGGFNNAGFNGLNSNLLGGNLAGVSSCGLVY